MTRIYELKAEYENRRFGWPYKSLIEALRGAEEYRQVYPGVRLRILSYVVPA